MEQGDDALTKRMKLHVLEQRGKLFYQIAHDFTGYSKFEEGEEEAKEDGQTGEQEIDDSLFDRTFLKGHKAAITCLDWELDNKSIITGSKDCCHIRWDLESQKKLFFRGVKFDRQIDGHYVEILCQAISPNGKYLVSGGKDRLVRVWDIHNQK